jgi:putative tryptophan/tyrosine transport system substrate-binding protein
MKRRDFITLVGGAAWPLAARAQRTAVPVIGFLSSGSTDLDAPLVRAFRQGLGEIGYVQGRNMTIEFRWAEAQYDRLPALAADLVRLHAAVIAVRGPPAAQAAKAATTTIPIVFQIGGDPVALEFVASLNRPGGNMTGVTILTGELGPKRLELLHELVPAATVIAFLDNPTNPILGPGTEPLRAAAQALGLQLHVLNASTDRDFETVFASLVQLRAGGLVISPDGLFSNRIEQLVALTLRHAVPTIFPRRDYIKAGGLIGYDASMTDSWRLAGLYAGRVLKGEKPADLPVQQATKLELIINLKTAKALGLTVPASLLVRADEVIE